MILYKGKCKTCGKVVLHHAENYDSPRVEMFEVAETRILVIVGSREVGGEKVAVVGPVRQGFPLLRPDFERPAVTAGHLKHGCTAQPGQNTGTGMSTTTPSLTNSTSTIPATPALPVEIVPIERPAESPFYSPLHRGGG